MSKTIDKGINKAIRPSVARKELHSLEKEEAKDQPDTCKY